MNKDFKTSLFRDFPALFGRCEIDCGDGWYAILRDLAEEIQHHDRKYKTSTSFTWVGSKKGILSLCVNLEDKELRKLIARATEESAGVCDFCGAPGHPKHLYGKWRVSCENCEDI